MVNRNGESLSKEQEKINSEEFMRKIDKLEKEMKSLELNLNIRVQRVENIKHAKVDINKVEN